MLAFNLEVSQQLDEVQILLDVAHSPPIVALLKARKANLEIRVFGNTKPTERPKAEDWEPLRKATLRRDKYTCQGCGTTGQTLNVHHIAQLQYGGNSELVNLITLCNDCHARIHNWLT